ncbi:MAG: response regulator [Pseudomonadota bacterium]
MASTETIAIVEDDPELGPLTRDLIKREGFEALLVSNGADLDGLLQSQKVDLIVLDLMLPGEDGLSICRRLRPVSTIPILMLTAKSDDVDKIVGLEVGADDYLAKPFNPRELVARLRAILRRSNDIGGYKSRSVEFAGFVANLDSFQLYRDGTEITITSGEFALLRAFLINPNRVLSRDFLMEKSQSRSTESFDRTVDVQISRLRAKLGDTPKAPVLIKTVRNAGYIFTATVRPT